MSLLALEAVAESGTANPAGAWTIELLMTTEMNEFSEAVYPTLANDSLKIWAFKARNKVEIEVGNDSYSTAMMTVLASVALIH